MNPKLQTLYGLKFNPFRPDVPIDALLTTPTVDAFLRRVEFGIADGAPHGGKDGRRVPSGRGQSHRWS